MITAEQRKLYWANLNQVFKNVGSSVTLAPSAQDISEFRAAFHAKHNLPASTKDFTKAHMDTFVAACAAITKPDDLAPQLRALDSPKMRLLNFILKGQAAQLHALDIPDPLAYIAKISQDKFNGRKPADLSESHHSIHGSYFSELEMLRNTIARTISKLRQDRGWTVHELLWNSGLGKTCQCAQCTRANQKVGIVAPRDPSAVDHQFGDTPGFLEDLHTDNVPF